MEASTHIKFLVWILLYLLIPIKGELNTEVIQFDASNFSDFMYDKKAELKYGNFVKLNGKRFKMNAFKVVPFVKKKNQCIKECLSEETCKSINVAEVDSEARKYDCHLLDSHIFDPVHYKEIEDAPRHDHFTMKTRCLSDGCMYRGTCYPNYTQNTFKCNCTRHYAGDRCQRDLCQECFNIGCTNYTSILNFPDKSTDQHVVISNLFDQPIQMFTISVWVQISQKYVNLVDRQNPSVFSFQADGNIDELGMVFNAEKDLWIWIQANGVYKVDTKQVFDDRWHHIALTRSDTTTFKLYLDGNSATTLAHKQYQPRLFKTKLRFALGQEQDSYLTGNYDSDQSFIGNMTGFNMWDRKFEDKEIMELSRKCPFEMQGNVLKWSDIVPRKSASLNRFCATLTNGDDLPFKDGNLCMRLQA